MSKARLLCRARVAGSKQASLSRTGSWGADLLVCGRAGVETRAAVISSLQMSWRSYWPAWCMILVNADSLLWPDVTGLFRPLSSASLLTAS